MDETAAEKLVSDYARIDFFEVQEIDIDIYLYLLRNAFIARMSETKEGREYLKNAARIRRTEPERDKLRERFGKKGAAENGE